MKNVLKLTMLLLAMGLFCGLMAVFGSDGKKDKENGITFPKTMYVNDKKGLNRRSEPAADSIKIGAYVYGEKIQVLERSSAPVTIGGITDYWYKTNANVTLGGKVYKHSWVFGGYLLENPPAPPQMIEFDKLALKGGVYYLNNVPFTGKAGYQKEMHEEWEFKDGKFHGEYGYYMDGCTTIGNYKNGKKHGKWEGWCNDEEHDIRIYEDDVLISE